MAGTTVSVPRRTRVAENVYQRVNHKTGKPLPGKFEFTYRDGSGRQVWETASTKSEARQRRAAIVARKSQGERVERTNLTVAEVAKLWLERGTGRTGAWDPRTRASYESIVKQTLERSFDPLVKPIGQVKLTELDVERVAQWVAGLQPRLSSSSAKARLSVLNQILKLAVRRGWIATNPVAKLEVGERPRARRHDIFVPTTEQVQALLAHAPTVDYQRLFTFLAYSGLRVSEARGLRWRSVDFERELVRVREQLGRDNKRKPNTKTEAARRDVVISPRLAALLKEVYLASEHKGDDDLVFCGPNGEGIDYTTIWRNFKKTVDDAELTLQEQGRVSPHVLRHYYASLLISKGLNVAYVSKQLGHADINITLQTYAHLFDAVDHAVQAREALDLAQTPVGSS